MVVSAPKSLCACLMPVAECVCPEEDEAPRCPHCLDDGMVCESHPEFPFGVDAEGHPGDCDMGIPCPACCPPIPEDGTHSIAEAFTPDWRRGSVTA